MKFELDHKLISKDVAIIKVAGEFDHFTYIEVRKLAFKLIKRGYFWLVFDLSETDFIDSPGLAVLVGALKRVRANKRKKGIINIVAPTEQVLKIFKTTGLVKVFRIYDNASSAVRSVYEDSLQFGAALDDESGWQWFPARIYTSEEKAGPAVEKALSQLLDTFGIEVVFGFSPERGSWFREFILRMKDSTALPTRDEALTLIQRAVEQQVLGMPQSRIDVAQSQAVAGLLVALEKTPNAVIQSGSVLLIKVRDVIVVRNLTQLELAHWERNPGLFHDPEKALSELQRAWDATIAVDEPQDASSA